MTVTLFLPCAAGVEPLLADEAARITGLAAEAGRGGVFVPGADARAAMALNLHSRLAQRLLWPLADGRYRDEHDLYDIARRVRWGDWIGPEQTIRVDSAAQRSPLRSLNFAALRVKDAVCDTLREATGARPSVDTRHPDLAIAMFAGPEHAALYADTSGEALFKRGWRDERDGGLKGEAPLKETLAAAMLAAAGWQGREADGPLFDPCCGAGTIAIEAAQLATGRAPGLGRRFAFERLAPFRDHAAAWRELRREAEERIHAPAVAVHAGDVSFRMTDFAARNAERAGVARAIEFRTADALQRPPPCDAGTLMLNPPYGERIGAKGQGRAERGAAFDRDRADAGDARAPRPARDDGAGFVFGSGNAARGPAGTRESGSGTGVAGARESGSGAGVTGAREGFEGGGSPAEFFAALAAHWKRRYAGWTAWVLSPEMKLPTLMRLKETRRVPLWNGPIECRLFRFDMVAGSMQPRDGARAGDDDAAAARPHGPTPEDDA